MLQSRKFIGILFILVLSISAKSQTDSSSKLLQVETGINLYSISVSGYNRGSVDITKKVYSEMFAQGGFVKFYIGSWAVRTGLKFDDFSYNKSEYNESIDMSIESYQVTLGAQRIYYSNNFSPFWAVDISYRHGFVEGDLFSNGAVGVRHTELKSHFNSIGTVLALGARYDIDERLSFTIETAVQLHYHSYEEYKEDRRFGQNILSYTPINNFGFSYRVDP